MGVDTYLSDAECVLLLELSLSHEELPLTPCILSLLTVSLILSKRVVSFASFVVLSSSTNIIELQSSGVFIIN